MTYGAEDIIYGVFIALSSLSLIILGVILVILCVKKPSPTSEQSISTKIIANSALPYSLAYIDVATDSFNPRRVIGTGRLGSVYAGVLPSGDLIAVKRIHPRLVLSSPSSFAFASALKSLSLANHPNVVQILGFSEAPGERIILMEFISMVDLNYYLHQKLEDATNLDWQRRLKIAAGIARGIEYLHEKMTPNVIHGCIKASNVLIDVKFCARICDFGLSFLAPNEKKGLSGHIDEEYWVDRKRVACKESDVFGFGVILLEILSGRISDEEGLLVKWAIPLIKEMKFSDFLDPRLVIPNDIKPLVRLAKVALACVANSRQHRPSIVQISSILNNLDI